MQALDTVPYGFGDTRAFTLALLIFTAPSGWCSCGVVITKFSGPCRHLPKFTNGRRGHSDVWVRLDPHLTWQATKSYVERGNALGLILHKGSSLFV